MALLRLLGSQRAEGRSAPNLLPRSNGLDTFPPSNAANARSGPFPAAKNTPKTLEVGGFLIGAKSQKTSSRRCAPIGAARASAPMAQW